VMITVMERTRPAGAPNSNGRPHACYTNGPPKQLAWRANDLGRCRAASMSAKAE